MIDAIAISTVTPVYAGAAFLPELVAALAEVRDDWESSPRMPFRLMESIFVIDAAIDDSADVLAALATGQPWIRVVTLSRNFGQHPASIAGLLHTSGDWVITLDEDLQHHPRFFLALMERMARESADLVYARPERAVHQAVVRDWSSRLFKAMMTLATSNKHIHQFNSFRLVRGPMARAAASVCSHETYLDIALCWFTNRIASVTLPLKDHRFIASGKSGYSFARLLGHARRMIVSSRTRVLRYATLLGAAATLLGFGLASAVFLWKILHPASVSVQGWSSLFVATVFFGGLVVFLLSVTLEYMTTILLHVQGKPTFFVVDRSLDDLARRFFEQRGPE